MNKLEALLTVFQVVVAASGLFVFFNLVLRDRDDVSRLDDLI